MEEPKFPYQPENLCEKEGWEAFCGRPPSIRPKPSTSLASFKRMSPRERHEFDELRLFHHATFGPLSTPALKKAMKVAPRLLLANQFLPPGPRTGLILDSEAGGQGKTTILNFIGRWWHRRQRAAYSAELTPNGHEFWPVARASLGSHPTLKGLNAELLRFFAAPPPRGTLRDSTEVLQELLYKCATSLLLIDDLNQLKLHRINDLQVNDHIKKLMSDVPATLVMAGINCRDSGVLGEGLPQTESAKSQTAGRFVRLAVEPFALSPRSRAAEWIALLQQIEAELVLMKASPGMLHERLRIYLFQRTNGEIGQLMRLIREGALAAVLNGSECLTQSLLDEIPLSYRVEARTPPRGDGRPR